MTGCGHTPYAASLFEDTCALKPAKDLPSFVQELCVGRRCGLKCLKYRVRAGYLSPVLWQQLVRSLPSCPAAAPSRELWGPWGPRFVGTGRWESSVTYVGCGVRRLSGAASTPGCNCATETRQYFVSGGGEGTGILDEWDHSLIGSTRRTRGYTWLCLPGPIRPICVCQGPIGPIRSASIRPTCVRPGPAGPPSGSMFASALPLQLSEQIVSSHSDSCTNGGRFAPAPAPAPASLPGRQTALLL